MSGVEDARAPAKTHQRDGILAKFDALCFITQAHLPCMFFKIMPGLQKVLSDQI